MQSFRHHSRYVQTHFSANSLSAFIDYMSHLKNSGMKPQYCSLTFSPDQRLSDGDIVKLVSVLNSEMFDYEVILELYNQDLKGDRLQAIYPLFGPAHHGPDRLGLRFASNDINDHDLQSFSQALRLMRKTKSFQLDFMQESISNEGVKLIADSFHAGNYPTEKLSVTYFSVNFSHEQAQSIARMLFSDAAPPIVHMTLLHCQLGNAGVDELVQEVLSGGEKHEISLKLRSNNIDAAGVSLLRPLLVGDKCPSRLELDLGENQIGSDGLKEILTAASAAKNLNVLDLNVSQCAISNDGLIALAEAIATETCPLEMKISIDRNEFDADGLAALSEALINRETEFINFVLFISLNGVDASWKNVLLDMMMKSTNVTGLVYFRNDPVSDQEKEWDNRVGICSVRNRLIRRYPDLRQFILDQCAKAGFYIQGNHKRTPSSLKTLAAFSLLSNLDPLGVRERKLQKLPHEVFSFIVELYNLNKDMEDQVSVVKKPGN